MPNKLRIGIVGCGAIGSSLAKTIVRDFKKDAKLAALYDIDAKRSERLSKSVSRRKNLAVYSLRKLVVKSGLVIEASSALSSFGIAKVALSAGCDIMVMSVGGIIGRLNRLYILAKRHKAKVYLPSGAISGIDAIKAAKLGKIKKVTLTTRKSPVSFKGVKFIEQKGIALEEIKKDKLLFSGPAQKAIRYFPQNINVAALLSLAGIGGTRTRVRIIASPKVKKNIHEILVESGAARIFTRTENILHPDNPKTSYLAYLSAVAGLRQILEPIKIGT